MITKFGRFLYHYCDDRQVPLLHNFSKLILHINNVFNSLKNLLLVLHNLLPRELQLFQMSFLLNQNLFVRLLQIELLSCTYKSITSLHHIAVSLYKVVQSVQDVKQKCWPLWSKHGNTIWKTRYANLIFTIKSSSGSTTYNSAKKWILKLEELVFFNCSSLPLPIKARKIRSIKGKRTSPDRNT